MVSTTGALPFPLVVVCDCEVDGEDIVNGVKERDIKEEDVVVDDDVLEDGADVGVAVGVGVGLVVVVEEVVVEEVVVEEVVVGDVVVEDVVVVELLSGAGAGVSRQLASSLGWIVRGPAPATWLALSNSSKLMEYPAGTGMVHGKPAPPIPEIPYALPQLPLLTDTWSLYVGVPPVQANAYVWHCTGLDTGCRNAKLS